MMIVEYVSNRRFLDRDPLDFNSAAVVEYDCPRRFMVSDLLGHFECAAVLQVRRGPGRAKGMIANPRFDPGRFDIIVQTLVEAMSLSELFGITAGGGSVSVQG